MHEVKKNTITPIPFKYRLKAILLDKYGAKHLEVRDNMLKDLGISYTSYTAHCNILQWQTTEIPKPKLMAYAHYLDIPFSQIIY